MKNTWGRGRKMRVVNITGIFGFFKILEQYGRIKIRQTIPNGGSKYCITLAFEESSWR